MTAYAETRRRRDDLADAVRQNAVALGAARLRYAQGAVDFLNVIAVQNAFLDSSQSLADADTQIRLSLVMLYRALGGGWDAIAP